jgi:hypothetical protein
MAYPWISCQSCHVFFYIQYINQQAARQRSRYSDCQQAGQSRDRNPVGARFSAPVQTGLEAHSASCTMGTRSFLGVRCSRGVTLTPHPLLVPRSKTEWSYTSTLPKGFRGQWKGETYLLTNKMHYVKYNKTQFMFVKWQLLHVSAPKSQPRKV